jgi:hypothetical protein
MEPGTGPAVCEQTWCEMRELARGQGQLPAYLEIDSALFQLAYLLCLLLV